MKELCIQRNLQEGYFGLEAERNIEAVQIQVIWRSEILVPSQDLEFSKYSRKCLNINGRHLKQMVLDKTSPDCKYLNNFQIGNILI